MSKMGKTEDPPELESTDQNVFEVMWLSSSDSSSQSGDFEDRAADVEDYLQKRRSTGSLNPKQMLGATVGTKADLWKCRACGWTYPSQHPTARQKLEHKKHCKGFREDAGLQDGDAGSDGSLEKQVYTNADEEIVTQSVVRSAVADSKSETNSMDTLVLTNGDSSKNFGNSRGEHLGPKGNGLHGHGVVVVSKQDDDVDELEPSSASSLSSLSPSSTSSSSSKEAVVSTVVQESPPAPHEPSADGEAVNIAEAHTENSLTEQCEPRVEDEAVVRTVLHVEEGLPDNHERSPDVQAAIPAVLHVEEALPGHDELLMDDSPQSSTSVQPSVNVAEPLVDDEAVVSTVSHVEEALPDNHERPSDVEAPILTVLYVEEAIPGHQELLVDDSPQSSTSVQPSVNLANPTFCEDVNQLTGAEAFHKDGKALGLPESPTNSTDSDRQQQEPARDLENANHSAPDSAMQEKHDGYHAPDLPKEPHSYIVESPREAMGWTEAGSSRDMEAYEVERVIRTQTSHDLICPYCRHNVTDRIILRKRKRTSRVSTENWVHDYDSSSTQEEVTLRQDAQDTAELDKDKAGFWGCLSCFTIFIPKRAEPRPAEASRDRAADILEDSKESSSCLPIFFTPFKWKPAEIIPPRPDGETLQKEEPASIGTGDAPPDALLAPASVSEHVERGSWLSCLPATLTSFEVPVVHIQVETKKDSAPESMERPGVPGILLVATPKPLTKEGLEVKVGTINTEETPSAISPVPAVKGKEYKSVEVVEEHYQHDRKGLSTSEIVEVPDDVPVASSSVDFVIDQVEKASCLSFLPATLTSFDVPSRVESQYKYTFKQMQDEGRASIFFDGHRDQDKSSILSCLPATLTTWEFPSTQVLEAQRDDNAVSSAGEMQEDNIVSFKAEVGAEGKSSCLSCLPVTFTSWEFPQTPNEGSRARISIEEDRQVKTTGQLKRGDDGSEGVLPARQPPLGQATETGCFSFIPHTFRSFDVEPKLKPQEIPSRISVPNPDLGKKAVHETVIQGSVTNTTAIEGPDQKATDMSVTYFRTSIKVEEAKRRFIRKKLGPMSGDHHGTDSEDKEVEDNADEEPGSDEDVQELTPEYEAAVFEGAPPPVMTAALLMPPGNSDTDLFEPESPDVSSKKQSSRISAVNDQSLQISTNVEISRPWAVDDKDLEEDTTLESSIPTPATRPTTVKIDRRNDWAELQVPLLSAERSWEADPGMTTVAISSVAIQVQGPDATDALVAAVTEAERTGVLQPTSDGLEGLEIVKSIVYGGLDSTLTSLAAVASAAGAEAKTITVVALGIANVIAGMITFFAKVTSLDRDTFRSTIGRNLWVNGSIAALSFIIFGMAAPLTFGFTFRESNDMDYKVYATCSVAVVSIVFLGYLKAYVKRINVWTTILGLLVTGFLSAVAGYFAGDYVRRLLNKYGFDFESGENLGTMDEVGRLRQRLRK